VKLATWNVNSLNVRLQRLLAWLGANRPDVVCLQETKLEDAKFPQVPLREAGYEAHFAGQKTYNGVAILVRPPLVASDVVRGIPGRDDPQQRVIAATVDGIRVISVYVPNGQEVGSEKYAYKLDWCAAAVRYFAAERAAHPALAVLGDFNVAPDDRDVHEPALWAGQVLCSEPERAAFASFLACGLRDSFRLFEQPPNHGLRIDHVLLSDELAARCTSSTIDRNERKGEKPSDHAPATAVLSQ
jgi:exodeoxyribonuclease III